MFELDNSACVKLGSLIAAFLYTLICSGLADALATCSVGCPVSRVQITSAHSIDSDTSS